MSDDYKIQLSSTVNGNLLNFRANSGEELAEVVNGTAGMLEDILSGFAAIKEGILAKDIFTGNMGTAKASGTSAPVPSAPVETGSDGLPKCKHGAMKDLRGRTGASGQPYKADFYCTAKSRDEQCKPVKL